jgi:hypothetical protein
MNETERLIAEQKKNLPHELVEAIESVAWEHSVEEIGNKNSLSTEQIDSLEREVMLALYAFEPPENLASNIAREVDVPEEVAETLFNSIWEQIMEPIGQKVEGVKIPINTNTPTNLPEIAPEIHPMVEEGEGAHDVIHNSIERPRHEPIVITNQEEKERELGHSSKKWVADYAEEKEIGQKDPVSVPDYRYPDGTDPYREPAK